VCNPRRNALLKEGSKSDKVDASQAGRVAAHGNVAGRSTTEKTDYGRCASWGAVYQTLSKDLNPSEKPSNGDKPLGLASPLQSATSQSGRTNHPSENETGPDVSHHTRISPRAGRSLFS